jgi:hypothetical protein
MRYALAPHVHIACVDGDVVLLDAAADRYACLPACNAREIRSGHAARWWDQGSLVAELAAAGYLMPSAEPPGEGRPPPVTCELDLHMLGGDVPALTVQDLTATALAGVSTAWRLAAQRPMHWLRPRRGETPRPDEAVALARRFTEAQLHLPRLSRCLPRSLALLDFLARRACPAQLVFGVRTHPFEAHCWVQAGNIVLNDTLSRVGWYTPIAWS